MVEPSRHPRVRAAANDWATLRGDRVLEQRAHFRGQAVVHSLLSREKNPSNLSEAGAWAVQRGLNGRDR